VPRADTSDVLAVDGHQHFWDPERVPLPWLRPEHAQIARAFEPDELEPQLRDARIARTILVQSACSDEDTDAMFVRAARHEWIAAVVAWAPLLDPARARERLDELSEQPKLRGIRHLIHDEADPHWILQPEVLESLALLEERGLVLELPVVFPRHLADVPELARSFPRLTIVIDHLGKPPSDGDAFTAWAKQLADAASHANVAAKVSGLDVGGDLRPAVETAFDAFGPDRLLAGSDWPVSLLGGVDYLRVWSEMRRVLELTARDDARTILRDTASRLYDLPHSNDGAH
jgi:L-fuconolactonase